MWMLQARQGGDLPYQPGEALRGLRLHLDLLDCILPAIKAVDGSHHNAIPALAKGLELLEVTFIPGQPCGTQARPCGCKQSV